jgi:hypothetical protein
LTDLTWRYECEDELEARGIALLLERRGLVFEKLHHTDGSVTLQCTGEHAGAAASLESEMLRHHAEQERSEGAKQWRNRDLVRDRRLRRVGLAILALLATVTLLRW